MDKLFVKASEVEPEIKSHGRQSRTLVAPKTVGAKGLAMGLAVIQPGGQSPTHIHEEEEEVMFFISGRGKVTVGEEEFDIEPDSAVLGPAKIPHGVVNTGNEELKFIWVFVPPKADQR